MKKGRRLSLKYQKAYMQHFNIFCNKINIINKGGDSVSNSKVLTTKLY
jgi:hypothetical protein